MVKLGFGFRVQGLKVYVRVSCSLQLQCSTNLNTSTGAGADDNDCGYQVGRSNRSAQLSSLQLGTSLSEGISSWILESHIRGIHV